MSNLKHYDNLGTVRFVTFSCRGRLPILRSPDVIGTVLKELECARTKYLFDLFGYVIMPEHVHVVLFPRTSISLGKVVGEIKSRSAREIIPILRSTSNPMSSELCRTRHGRSESSLWFPRCYDHNCRSLDSVLDKINYCHWNPVRRGLVNRPEDWPWSSYRYYQDEKVGLVVVDSLL